MAIDKSLRPIVVGGTCLLLLTSCAANPEVGGRFEAECKAAGYAEGSQAFAACVEQKWSAFRFVPKHGGR